MSMRKRDVLSNFGISQLFTNNFKNEKFIEIITEHRICI